MSPGPSLFQNKFRALAQRLEEVSNFDLKYDENFTGLRGKTIEHLDLSMICESIGISDNEVFFELVQDKFNNIVEELCEHIYSDTLPRLIEKGVFGFKSTDGTTLKDRLMIMVKQVYNNPDTHYIRFTQSHEIENMPQKHDLYDLYWKRFSQGECTNHHPLYLCPYMLLEDPHVDWSAFANSRSGNDENFPQSWQYEISLDIMLERACMIHESHYQLLQWVKMMCN